MNIYVSKSQLRNGEYNIETLLDDIPEAELFESMPEQTEEPEEQEESPKEEKPAENIQESPLEKSDGCDIIKEDQDRPGAPDGNDNAAKDHVKKSDAERVEQLKSDIASGKANLKLRTQMQNKHRAGTKEYSQYEQSRISKEQTPPSRVLDCISDEKLLSMVLPKIGSDSLEVAKDGGLREFVEFDDYVGENYNTKTQRFEKTKRVQVKYSNNGIHIIPVKEVSSNE